MGSFAGHIDESIFFLFLAFWWMLNKFPRYIRSQWNKTEYRARLSYALPTSKFIPLEAILKVMFPFGALMAEILSNGLELIDVDGNFRKLGQMQHMSIFGIFAVHGVIDVAMSYGLPLPDGLDFLSASAAFFWYGQSFGFHAHMHGKAELETTIHVLPMTTIYACGFAGLAEALDRRCFAASLTRIFCVLTLGTWFTQASFVMYAPFPFPGSVLWCFSVFFMAGDQRNPNWNQTDARNVNFIVASFGYHMIMNMVIVTAVYLLCYAYLRIKGEGGRNQFKRLPFDCPEENEGGCQSKPLLTSSSSSSEGQ